MTVHSHWSGTGVQDDLMGGKPAAHKQNATRTL